MSNSHVETRLIVVCTIPQEEAVTVFADICRVVEDCMIIEEAEWQTDNGVAVFKGITANSLSFVTAKLYSNPVSGTRVRKIGYSEQRKHS